MSRKSGESQVPDDLRGALEAAPAAKDKWNGLTPVSRRDFVSWINDAKQPETRKRRIVRCCENLIKGKRRPCCYSVVPMDFYKALGSDPKAKAQWSALSANEKRDFRDWIDASEDKATSRIRIEVACAVLAAGKRLPYRSY